MLASEYGWSKREILEETYPDEFYYLMQKITRRNLTADRKLVIYHHTSDPKALLDSIDQLDPDFEENYKKEELDSTGMELLKLRMSQNPHFVVK